MTFGEAVHDIESLFFSTPFMRHTRRDVLAKKSASVALIPINDPTRIVVCNLAFPVKHSFNWNYFHYYQNNRVNCFLHTFFNLEEVQLSLMLWEF